VKIETYLSRIQTKHLGMPQVGILAAFATLAAGLVGLGKAQDSNCIPLGLILAGAFVMTSLLIIHIWQRSLRVGAKRQPPSCRAASKSKHVPKELRQARTQKPTKRQTRKRLR
jgi:hypothetical protein